MKKHLLFLLLMLSAAFANAQRVTVTIAGTGYSGYSGDNFGAKQARLKNPYDVCIDAAHNVYFSDQSNTRIRKVDAKTGAITTIAGGGTSTADGISALSASIAVGSIISDPAGNIYFSSNNRVRRVDAVTNIITTIAGTGVNGFSGDGGPATAAQVNNVKGICRDNAGNIYLVDAGNQRIRKIEASTGVINTIAGNGTAAYTGDGGFALAATMYSPTYICLNKLGDIYFGDQTTVRIRKIEAATGVISTVIGAPAWGSTLYNCPGLSCTVGPLSGLCCDDSDNVIFNEMSCSCRKWKASTDWVSPVAGNFTIEAFRNDTSADFAYMNNNYGICSDEANNFYVADMMNNRIRKIIQLTNKPTFAFGDAQTIKPCPGYTYSVDSTLWITDMDSAQTETWTMLSAPLHGTVAGLPATTLSNGVHETVKPSGVSYTSSSGYTGADSFKVQVSDGVTSDIITIYVSVQTPPAGPSISYTSTNICPGTTSTMTGSGVGGLWTASNVHASVGSTSGIVSGVTAGVDTIAYTYFDGCPLSATVQVTVNPLPSAGTITGGDTVCLGGTLSLSSTVAGGTWTSLSTFYATITGTGVVSGVNDGATTIRYVVFDGVCTGIATKTIVVHHPNPGIVSGASSVCEGTSITLTPSVPGGVFSTTATGATVSTAGVVTGVTSGGAAINYVVTNSLGCTGTTSYGVTVVASTLSAGMIGGPGVLCPGSTITLLETVLGGAWTIGGSGASISTSGVVTGISAGTEIVTYTVSNMCTSASAFKTIIVVPMPNAGTITGTDNVCANASITLSNTSGGGNWYTGDMNVYVSPSGVVYGLAPGTSTIYYYVSNYCGDATTSKTITVNDCDLQPESIPVAPQTVINVYPNPASSVLTVNWDALPAGNTSISLTDATGRVVMHHDVSQHTTGSKEFNVSSLANGVYLLTVSGDEIHFVRKVVINN